MRVLCSISGIEFSCEHMPGYLDSRESYHPIFDVPQSKLFWYVKKWAAGELTETDSFLLYLSMFNSTKLIEWRVPVKRTVKTKSIVAAHMEHLTRVIGQINAISSPILKLHKIAILPDNNDLSSSHIWIQNWQDSIERFHNGYRDDIKHDRIAHMERKLDYFLRKPDVPVERYAKIIADWAADVADFPTATIRVNGNLTSISEYWKSIIIKCCKQNGIFSISEGDLSELKDHCEEAIDLHGSHFGHALMAILSHGMRILNDPFEINTLNYDIHHPGFTILPSVNTTQQTAITQSMIAAAPESKPLESEIGTVYPSKIAYLRAKARWETAMAEQEKIDKLEAIHGIIEKDTVEHMDDETDAESDEKLHPNEDAMNHIDETEESINSDDEENLL